MAYNDRVSQAADSIQKQIESGNYPVPENADDKKREFMGFVVRWAISNKTYEASVYHNRKEVMLTFVKDVQKELNSRGVRLPRLKSPTKEDNLGKIANLISTAVGNSIPDGDPIDYIMRNWRSATGEPYRGQYIGDILDKAAKKHLGSKSYHDYVANVWDDFNTDYGEGRFGENPWR